AWVEPSAAQGTARRFIVGKEGSGELAYGLYSNTGMSTPAGGLSLGGAGESIARGPTQLPVGSSWSYLAVTYDGSTVRLYVNGADVGDLAVARRIDVTSGALRIGGNSVLGEYFNGLVDDVRVYNRALSASDVQADMNTPVDPPPWAHSDKTAPSAPSSLTKTGSTTSSVSISWTASTDNVGVAGYGVYKNGAGVGSTTSTSFT